VNKTVSINSYVVEVDGVALDTFYDCTDLAKAKRRARDTSKRGPLCHVVAFDETGETVGHIVYSYGQQSGIEGHVVDAVIDGEPTQDDIDFCVEMVCQALDEHRDHTFLPVSSWDGASACRDAMFTDSNTDEDYKRAQLLLNGIPALRAAVVALVDEWIAQNEDDEGEDEDTVDADESFDRVVEDNRTMDEALEDRIAEQDRDMDETVNGVAMARSLQALRDALNGADVYASNYGYLASTIYDIGKLPKFSGDMDGIDPHVFSCDDTNVLIHYSGLVVGARWQLRRRHDTICMLGDEEMEGYPVMQTEDSRDTIMPIVAYRRGEGLPGLVMVLGHQGRAWSNRAFKDEQAIIDRIAHWNSQGKSHGMYLVEGGPRDTWDIDERKLDSRLPDANAGR